MQTTSRRNVLRLFGGVAGAGIVGVSSVSGLAPSFASPDTRELRHPSSTPSSTPTPAPAPVVAAGTTLIGMSSPASLWAQRVSEVGPGLGARRIFADLASGATSQLKLVEQAHAAGMLPVISYKVGGDASGAASGRFNAVAAEAAARLAAYGKPTAVTFWHEPNGDITPAQYVAASKQILPNFKRDQLRVGPILNGWLLDRQQSTFAAFAPDEMLGLWDWFGIDSYQPGTMSSPNTSVMPVDRLTKLNDWLAAKGHADMPVGVGEYNGFSAEAIQGMGEGLLSRPNTWFGCVWNVDEARAGLLTGDRLAAFKQTLADPRSA